MMADARHTKDAAVDANIGAYSPAASRVTPRQAIAFRGDFHGWARALPLPSKHQCKRQKARAEARVEKRGIVTKLATNAGAKSGGGGTRSAAPR